MLIHLGYGLTLPARDIIAVIDMHSANSRDTEHFLSTKAKENFIRHIGEEPPRSMVITNGCVYLVPVRPCTLLRRTCAL